MRDFEILKKEELKEFLEDRELEDLFENEEIIEEFQVDSSNFSVVYDKELKIY